MRKSILLVLIIVLLTACSGNSNNPEEAGKLNIITGINLVDVTGTTNGVYGNPNVLRNDSGTNAKNRKDDEPISVSDIISSVFTVYPTIVEDVFSIGTSKKVKKLWIVKGVPTRDFQNIDFESTLSNGMYTSKEIGDSAVEDIDLQTSGTPIINVSGYAKGFYRVFIETEEGEIYWENISIGYSEREANFW
ncbi:hypothetical protein [Tenacibaculum agarivorans]|uniref:hypothetical protein n=1 Tax=Tenacibaculum agarivorans TaxID=1908389 RepID=UPI00094B8DBB|nr:hypothetical protein [Tenacibaculum agarivorans]